MDDDRLISICIPTRNNAKYLKECLESLAPQVAPHHVPIYVSDNASRDNTIEMLSSFKKNVYPRVYCRSNDRDLGFDQNLINAVTMASTKYVWPLGDRRRLLPDSFERVYRLLLGTDLDLLLLGVDRKRFSSQVKRYGSAKEVFSELFSNAGTLGFFVLPREAWKYEMLKKYVGSGWVHFAVIFEYLAGLKDVDVRLAEWPTIASSGKSAWTRNFFNVWTNWKNVVNNLSDLYSKEDKESIIRAFMTNRSITLLVKLRAEGIYNREIYDRYEQDFLKYTQFSLVVAKAIADLPAIVFKPYPILRNLLSKVLKTYVRTARVR
jgi:glycosyltransferase involved in cell wall biosynthesis